MSEDLSAIIVSVTDTLRTSNDPTQPSLVLDIKIQSSVTFHPSSGAPKRLRDPQSDRSHETRLPLHSLTSEDGAPGTPLRAAVAALLRDPNAVSFPLERLQWLSRGDSGASKAPTPLSSADELVDRILDAARNAAARFPFNVLRKRVVLFVSLQKKINLSREKFEAMDLKRGRREREEELEKYVAWMTRQGVALGWDDEGLMRRVEDAVGRRAAPPNSFPEFKVVGYEKDLLRRMKGVARHARLMALVGEVGAITVDVAAAAEKEEMCLICQAEFAAVAAEETAALATQLPCGHVFHRTCMARWIERSRTCPKCRLELPPTSSKN